MADNINGNNFDYLTAVRQLEFSKIVYPALYAEFNTILAFSGAKSWSPDDPGFQNALKEFARRFAEFLLTHPESVTEIDKVAPREMVEKVFNEAKSIPGLHDESFARRVAQNYIKESKKRGFTIANEAVVAEELAKNLKSASGKSKTSEELAQQTSATVAQSPDLAAQIQPQILSQVINDRQEEIVQFADREQVVSVVIQEALTAPIERPDIYTKVFGGLWAEGQTSAVGRTKHAERLTRVASALLADAHPDTDRVSNFFSDYAQTGAQAGVAAVADVLNGALNKENALQALDFATGKAFKKTVEKAAKDPGLQERLGPVFIASPVFKDLKTSGEKALHVAPVAEHNIIKRWAAAVITSQASAILAQTPEQTIEDVFTLTKLGVFKGDLSVNFKTPSPPRGDLVAGALTKIHAQGTLGVAYFVWNTRELFLAAVYAHSPTAFHLDFSSISGWLLQKGAREVVGGGLIKTAAGTGAKGFLGKTGAALLGSAGGPLGFLAGWVGGDLLTKFAGGVVNRIKGLFGGGKAGVGGPSFVDRNLITILAAGVVIIIALFVLPFSFNPLNNIADKVRTVALETSGEKPVGGGATANLTKYSYPDIPLPPTSTITRCPVDLVPTEHITQGPNQGNHTGDLANSYDIGLPTGTEVHPSHSGVVVELVGSVVGNSPGITSPGNFVKIEGTTVEGKTYFTTYEHLLDIARGLKVGDPITPEAVLGLSDNTGNSTGPHLHYQCDGPICASMLPVGCGGR